jgi:hypothetical protein
MRLVLLALGLTFVLGCTTALAFYLVGGQVALNGPYVVGYAWPIIYPLEATFVAAIVGGVAFLFARSLDRGSVLLLALAAWIGEYFVLASGVFADELNPVNSVFYWLLATGGPMQPIAATLGGWLALRLAQRLRSAG